MSASSLLRASLLGGVDGVITSFVVVSSAHAGTLATSVALVIGASSVLADGLSMGVSEFLSSTAERAAGPTAGPAAGPSLATPLRLGAACFAAFVVCGTVPLLVYVATAGSLLVTSLFSLLALMGLGGARTRSTGEPLLIGLVQTSLLGTAAGGVAYGVGVLTTAVASGGTGGTGGSGGA